MRSVLLGLAGGFVGGWAGAWAFAWNLILGMRAEQAKAATLEAP